MLFQMWQSGLKCFTAPSFLCLKVNVQMLNDLTFSIFSIGIGVVVVVVVFFNYYYYYYY